MIRRFYEESDRPRVRRRDAFAMAIWMLFTTLLIPLPVQAGSIFDDNWAPPGPANPADTTGAKPEPPRTKPDAPTRSALPRKMTPLPASDTVTPPRRPIPAPLDQAKSRQLFKEIFAKELADRSALARRALAVKLLDQAAGVSDAPTDQFVLLIGAARSASEGSDLGLCCRAADALAEEYDVDGLRLKGDLATKMMLRADSASITADNCQAGLKLANQLIAAEDWPTASRLLDALRSAAPDADSSSEIQHRAKDFDARRAAAGRAAPYFQKLKLAPDDAAANLAVGRYLCFIKGDWARGLPALAKGGKPGLSVTAALDLAGASEVDRQVELGDKWWSAAEKESGPSQLAIRQRAASWYSMAIQGGTVPGLRRVLIEKRIATAMFGLVYTFSNPSSLADFDIVGNAAIRPEGGVELSHGTPSEIRTKAMFRTPLRVEFEAYCMPEGVLDIVPCILSNSGSDHGGFSACLGDSYNMSTNIHVFGTKVDLKHTPLKAHEVHRIILSVDKDGKAEAEIDGTLVYKGMAPRDRKLEGHVTLSGGRGDVVYTKVVIHAENTGGE